MVADYLVELKLAHWNPAFDPNAKLDAGCATVGVGSATEMIIIDKPDRVLSFDETRVELDMTKSSKEKRAKTLIDKSVERSTAAETIASKGGLQGTGVGGSTASGRACAPRAICVPGGEPKASVAFKVSRLRLLR